MAKAKSINSNSTHDAADDQADLPHAKDIFAPEDVARLEKSIAADCWSEPMTAEEVIDLIWNNKPIL